MDGVDRPKLLKNQPYDESVEVNDAEEVSSVYSPAPQEYAQFQSQWRRSISRRGRSLMSANSSSDELEERKEPMSIQPGATPTEEEEEESDEEETEDDDDDEAPEGAYDPAHYANLPISTEVKELFQYITRYTPPTVELDHSLRPFIPDFIPAVGDIDAFLKVPRPDSQSDSLGLLVLDEPSVKQSDPTVLSLWLSEETKQHPNTELKKVTSVASPQLNPRPVDSWVASMEALHRSKPAASVQYVRPAPDIDALMQEWPPDMEALLGGGVSLPSARLCCDLGQYCDLICALVDIPVYRGWSQNQDQNQGRIQALHLLFSLYLEFRDFQHVIRT